MSARNSTFGNKGKALCGLRNMSSTRPSWMRSPSMSKRRMYWAYIPKEVQSNGDMCLLNAYRVFRGQIDIMLEILTDLLLFNGDIAWNISRQVVTSPPSTLSAAWRQRRHIWAILHRLEPSAISVISYTSSHGRLDQIPGFRLVMEVWHGTLKRDIYHRDLQQ